MRCQNCNKDIPDSAKVCLYCEASVEAAPTDEEMDIARQFLAQMPQDVFAEFQKAMSSCDTAEEFANSIIVGECPVCGSSKTGDCENDLDIGELLVGRCYDCGKLFCTECLKPIDAKKPECPCWEEDIDDD